MVFSTEIKRFNQQGEKTGWTYIEIPVEMAEMLSPGTRKSFYVKGRLDGWPFSGRALLPMGNGCFIMALDASVRKAIGKGKGAVIEVEMRKDKPPVIECPELMECLADTEAGSSSFSRLSPSHQAYFIKWINSAKTDVTRSKRITQTVMAMEQGLNYVEMIHYFRDHPLG